MLSNSEEWRASIKSLAEYSNDEGITAIRAAVHELESAGYAVRKRLAAVDGKFAGYMWTWYDSPISMEHRSKPVIRKTDDGLPDDGLPDDGKPHELRRTISKEENKKESKVISKRSSKPSSSDFSTEALLTADDIEW